MKCNLLDLTVTLAIQVEATQAHQVGVLITQTLHPRLRIVLHTIDLLVQVQAQELDSLVEEINPPPTTQEMDQAGRQAHQALVRQADQVQEEVTVHQVEVQVGPRVARAQEDPEEGGINSPFFLENLSENNHNFVTIPT